VPLLERLSPEQRAKYYTELTGKQSIWRSTLRTKVRSVINSIASAPSVGEVDVGVDAEGNPTTPRAVVVSQAAQLQLYHLIREAEAKEKPLDEATFIPLAIAEVTRIKQEANQDNGNGIESVKQRYLGLGPETPAPETGKHVVTVDMNTGFEYLNGQPTGRNMKPASSFVVGQTLTNSKGESFTVVGFDSLGKPQLQRKR
jgi:hypothetical protein